MKKTIAEPEFTIHTIDSSMSTMSNITNTYFIPLSYPLIYIHVYIMDTHTYLALT